MAFCLGFWDSNCNLVLVLNCIVSLINHSLRFSIVWTFPFLFYYFVFFLHIDRLGNKLAHLLAKMGIDLGFSLKWIRNILSNVTLALKANLY